MDERISMGRWCPPWVKFQHLERYRWACRYVKERVVLDAACGTGYGSQMLLHQGKAALVYGVDLSEAAIKEATSCLADENARWSLGDVTKLDFQNDSIDVYVSFETLEHVPNDVGYVAEAARVVKPDGVFLCSTPNRKLFHPGATLETKPQNPFHVREYVKEELESLLKITSARSRGLGKRHFLRDIRVFFLPSVKLRKHYRFEVIRQRN